MLAIFKIIYLCNKQFRNNKSRNITSILRRGSKLSCYNGYLSANADKITLLFNLIKN